MELVRKNFANASIIFRFTGIVTKSTPGKGSRRAAMRPVRTFFHGPPGPVVLGETI
jgi:hypothetical protein